MNATLKPGANVFIDGRDAAVIAAAFPDGSTSYAFPHYKVHVVGGERNIAVAMSRIGLARKP